MRIGIDANALTNNFQNGTKRYARELINALAKIDKKNTYILFVSKKVSIPNQKNFRQVVIPRHILLNRQYFLPLTIKKHNVDVFHNLDPFGSIFIKHPKIITTVHDVNLSLVYPTFKNFKYLFSRLYSEIVRYFTLRNSKAIIAVSDTTLKDIELYLGSSFNRKNTTKIYEAHSIVFRKRKTNNHVLKHILCMGDFSPRKNIKGVIESYRLLDEHHKNKYKLYVVVSTKEQSHYFKELSIKLGLLKHIKVLISPSDSKLNILYQTALCFVYPSFYEGFGLPILESMASGCPVITSNYGAMKEIAGRASFLVNPNSPVDISRAISKIINEVDTRKKLIEKGFKRSNQFSWSISARQTLKLYKQIGLHMYNYQK